MYFVLRLIVVLSQLFLVSYLWKNGYLQLYFTCEVLIVFLWDSAYLTLLLQPNCNAPLLTCTEHLSMSSDDFIRRKKCWNWFGILHGTPLLDDCYMHVYVWSLRPCKMARNLVIFYGQHFECANTFNYKY